MYVYIQDCLLITLFNGQAIGMHMGLKSKGCLTVYSLKSIKMSYVHVNLHSLN